MTQEKLQQALKLSKQIAYNKAQLETLRGNTTTLYARSGFDDSDLSDIPGLKETAINLLTAHINKLEAEFAAL